MKREELKTLGLTDEQINKVMDLNGDDINTEKGKTTKALSERDAAIAERDTANTTLKSFEGIDVKDIQGKLRQYEIDITDLKNSHSAELAKRDRKSETDKFLSGLKFVNDETREYYTIKLESELDNETSKGKSRQEILDNFTKNEKGEQKPNIFVSEDNNPHKFIPNIQASGNNNINTPTIKTNLNAHRLIK